MVISRQTPIRPNQDEKNENIFLHENTPRQSWTFILLQQYTTSINLHWSLCLGKGICFGRTLLASFCELFNSGHSTNYYSMVQALLVIWRLNVIVGSPAHVQEYVSTMYARGRRYGDICICIVDSLCYKAETNTPL